MTRRKLDKVISAKIDEILVEADLSEALFLTIKSSLSVENKHGERFKWAHLTLLACQLVSDKLEDALPGAVAMELFALAADIFDDTLDQDNDSLPWRKLPDSQAINLAICLLALSFQAALSLTDNKRAQEIGRVFSLAGIHASDGQFQESLQTYCEKVALQEYFDVVSKKSGSLTGCACKIGSLLGGAPQAVVSQLEQFGVNLGVMSQVQNDLNDFLDLENKKDFVERRKTLPYVYLDSTLEGEKAELFNQLKLAATESLGFGHQEQQSLRELVLTEGAVQYCMVVYEMFRQTARGILKSIPVPQKRKGKLISIVGKGI